MTDAKDPEQIDHQASLPALPAAERAALVNRLKKLLAHATHPAVLREQLLANDELALFLAPLIGQQIEAGSSLITFGQGGQFGDVTIRDIVGGNVITFNIYCDTSSTSSHTIQAPPDRSAFRRLWQQARRAFLRRQWVQAETLFAQVAAINPDYEDVQARLAETRRQIDLQKCYEALATLRAYNRWEELLTELASIQQFQPDYPDPEGHYVWALRHQHCESRYETALAAAESQNWAEAIASLERLVAEAPDDEAARGLLEYARTNQSPAAQHQRVTKELDGRTWSDSAGAALDVPAAGRAEESPPPDPAERYASTAGVQESPLPSPRPKVLPEPSAQLSDDRVPVMIKGWGAELELRNTRFNEPKDYFCYVRPGAYRIGGWERNQPAATVTLAGFWLARYPITVAQYAVFVRCGYDLQARHWWTEEGWQWKCRSPETMQPYKWSQAPFSAPDQPVVGVTWYEATAFCNWLSDSLCEKLPAGYVLRLPTEAEWEVAAAYDQANRRRHYPWGDTEPDSSRAMYDVSKLGHPGPVGSCAAGAAACGVEDMAGNVWEITASSFQHYPAQSSMVMDDCAPRSGDIAWRGGSYSQDSSFVRCGARIKSRPDGYGYAGLRVVLGLQR